MFTPIKFWIFSILIPAVTGMFFSCATFSAFDYNLQPESAETYLPPFQPEFQESEGFGYFLFENKKIPLRYHLISLDLNTSNLKIVSYPESEDDFLKSGGKRTQFIKGIKISDFYSKKKPRIAINSTPYKLKKNSPLRKIFSDKFEIVGINIFSGKKLSEPVRKYSALIIEEKNGSFETSITKNQTEETFSDVFFAAGGFFEILKDGKKSSFKAESYDARTAIGIFPEKNKITILCVEKNHSSKGLSFQQCQEIFLRLGVSDAIQFDGGTSTSLFIDGKNMLKNHYQRKNAAYIGFSFNKN